jgi:alpha-N-arabinofuranosidase
MRAADPSIELIGVGETGPWDEAMLTHCADHMSYLSEHIYVQERPSLLAHSRLLANAIRAKAERHRDYRKRLPSLQGRDIRIVMDEWNHWYGPHAFGELGTRYFLKDALGVAGGLHEFFRQSDLYVMANYAQTVNVIGCIKTSKTRAAMETTGLVLALYRRHFGTIPVATESTPQIDAMAAWSADGSALTVGVVNPSLERRTVVLELRGATVTGRGKRFKVAGNDPLAHNDPDRPPRVTIGEGECDLTAGQVDLAPCSVSLLVVPVR